MFLLLDIQNGPVLERPLHDVGLGRCALFVLALFKLAPEFVEVLELDQVPDLGEWGRDDSGLADGGGGWDCCRHGGRRKQSLRKERRLTVFLKRYMNDREER